MLFFCAALALSLGPHVRSRSDPKASAPGRVTVVVVAAQAGEPKKLFNRHHAKVRALR
ncbi:hypothetical protein GCM10009527_076510 [Actinomadura nitritigenes]|uniref:Uncharacterized protein n=1 Tax=Actinomadura nitritigenes TaxID=134602 RepID=A0ABS3RG77_9ACTN|nr:hypothetical protein [Actinomadura nitritigenes]MBO2445156.1 hypothetical protein [Actinomadura nitritigenes]